MKTPTEAKQATESSYTPDNQVVVSLRHLIDMQYKACSFRFASPHMINSLMMGRHRSRMRGRGLNFEELRHYRVGDDIRNMDWKVTNRTRKPHVRVYAEERERQVMVVIDQRASMLFGSKRVMKSVAAAELGALAAWRTLDAGDRIGAVIFSDNHIAEIRPHRSRTQIMRTLSVLQEYNQSLLTGVTPSMAGQPQANNGEQLNHILNKLNALAGHDMQICLFTDLYGADTTTEKLMATLSQHNDVLLGFVYDPLEGELPQGGTMAVSDGGLQLEVNTRDKSLRERYKAFFDQRLDHARKFLRGYGIPVLPFSTHEPVDVQLAQMIEGV
ncbi:DUF58 domain-containing protein [Maricurvus nonylphenolicus]|uniref:DUF58 domain-containing protein n=1 Tax=Maricurvus nonylphenolicus TaxID=1008307 RepID=UPI0036F394DC